MIPMTDYGISISRRGKFRPKIRKKRTIKANKNDTELLESYHDKEGKYTRDKGKYPVFTMGHKKVVLGHTTPAYRPYGASDKNPAPGSSQFRQLPAEFLQNTTFITEAPQGMSGVFGLTHLQDPTQREVVGYVHGSPDKNNRLVCADGRKACDENGKLHQIMGAHDEASPPMINYKEISEERTVDFAERYLNHLLLKNSTNVSQFVSEVTDMVGNSPGTSPEFVIRQTSNRVLQLVSRLTEDQKKALGDSVMAELREDLQQAKETYKKALFQLGEEKQQYEEGVNEKLAELRPKQELLPEEAYQNRISEIVEETGDAMKQEAIKETKKYNQNILFALRDIFANVLLLAEVAGAEAQNIAVSYTKTNLSPLRLMIRRFNLIEDTKPGNRRYSRAGND